MASLCALPLAGCPVEESPTPARVEIGPAEGVAGTTFPVTVRGTNTHFSSKDFDARFEGRGVHIDSSAPGDGIRVGGETAARLRVRIDADAAAGPHVLRIDAPPDSFETTLDVRVPGEESSVAIRPRYGAPGAELDLTLDGRATHFDDDVTTVLFPELAGVTVLSVRVLSPTLATARVRISVDAPAGAALAAVVTRDEVVVDDLEIVTTATPAVSVEPPEGYSGNDVDVVVTGARADFGGEGDVVELTFEPGAKIAVSDLTVRAPTRLRARLSIAPGARAGFRRFTVRVDPGEPGALPREFAGTFSVRAPDNPAVRLLPAVLPRGEPAFLWLEGSGTAFDDALQVVPAAQSGITVTGTWVFGPDAAAVRVQVASDAPPGAVTFTVEDGPRADLEAALHVIEGAAAPIAVAPTFVESGRSGIVLELSSPDDFDVSRTRVLAAPRSGIAVRSVRVDEDQPSRATVVVDVQESAPTGPTSLRVSTGSVSSSQVALEVLPASGHGSITIDPPVVRAGLGRVDLVLTPAEATLSSATVAEISDPAISIGPVVVDEATHVGRVSVDVPRSTSPGDAILVIADGPHRFATTLRVLPAVPPVVVAAPSSLQAGRAEQPIVVFGVRTSWIAGVTVAAAPAGRGLSVEGLTVLDAETALLQVTVSSEAPLGATGILLATHGEVAVAQLEIGPPKATAEIVLDPPAVEPGAIVTVIMSGVNVAFSGVPVRVDFPGSPEIQVSRTLVLDGSTLSVDLEVDADAQPGTRPCEVVAPGLRVRAGLAVRSPGDPAMWVEPGRIVGAQVVRLQLRVDGMDLSTGAVTATADEPGVILGEVVVGETTDRASVDVSVPGDAAIGSFWLTVATGVATARHRVLVSPPLAQASAGDASVEVGSSGTELVLTGTSTSFAPEETLVLTGPSSSVLHFGRPVVTSPGQLRVPVDVSAAAEVEESQVVVVTGSELVVVDLPIHGAGRARFSSSDGVDGAVLPDRGAILAFEGDDDRLLWLGVTSTLDERQLQMDVLAPDGFTPLAAPVTSPARLALRLPADALVRLHAANVEGEVDPLPFTFAVGPVVPDAARELEPNDDLSGAELIPDPVRSPTVMSGRFEPTYDRDVFVVTAATPVAFELFARRLGAGVVAPDIGIRAPAGGSLVAPDSGGDLVAVLQPGFPGEETAVSFEALAGGRGNYLVVARSAVVVNEIGWSEEGGYLELRTAPGMRLDGFGFEVHGLAFRVLLPEVELDGVQADETGLVLLSPGGDADRRVPELSLPRDGSVIVLWEGQPVDEVEFGAATGVVGPPIDVVGADAVARRLGIDSNNNQKDFEAVTPSPGTE